MGPSWTHHTCLGFVSAHRLSDNNRGEADRRLLAAGSCHDIPEHSLKLHPTDELTSYFR